MEGRSEGEWSDVVPSPSRKSSKRLEPAGWKSKLSKTRQSQVTSSSSPLQLEGEKGSSQKLVSSDHLLLLCLSHSHAYKIDPINPSDRSLSLPFLT